MGELAWAWVTPRIKGRVVEYTYYHGVVTGWIRLIEDETIWVHFHSANFKATCKDELHALAEDDMLGRIVVSFYVDQYTHRTADDDEANMQSAVQPTAMAIMPDPELTWGMGTHSKKWWAVASMKWRKLEEKKRDKKRKREKEPQPPEYPPEGAQW